MKSNKALLTYLETAECSTHGDFWLGTRPGTSQGSEAPPGSAYVSFDVWTFHESEDIILYEGQWSETFQNAKPQVSLSHACARLYHNIGATMITLMPNMIPMIPIIKARSINGSLSKRRLRVYDGQRRLWKEDDVMVASDPTSTVASIDWEEWEHDMRKLFPDIGFKEIRAMKAADGGVREESTDDAVSETKGNKCTICHREFPLRKTMLRHLRTVHAPKNLACPTCGKRFIRQDNLSRHIGEQHSADDRFIKCNSCGREVSRRALPEHMASRICKASQKTSRNKSTDQSDHLYVEDEGDCFLLTMRVLKLWLPLAKKQVQSTSSSGEAASQDPSGTAAYAECISMGARALLSMHSQMADDPKLTECLRLFCTAVLWTCISLIGVQGVDDAPAGFLDWAAHLKGAAVLLRVFHDHDCDCKEHLSCQKLRKRADRDPALLLFKDIVRDAGLIGILLNVLPGMVTTFEHSIQLIDVLLKCIVSQIGRCGDELASCQSFCEANGIAFDNEQSRGMEAMIWAILRVHSEEGARSAKPP